jgi:hypothetical protein
VQDENNSLEMTWWNKKSCNQEMVGVGCLIPSMVSAGINYGLASPPHNAAEPESGSIPL